MVALYIIFFVLWGIAFAYFLANLICTLIRRKANPEQQKFDLLFFKKKYNVDSKK